MTAVLCVMASLILLLTLTTAIEDTRDKLHLYGIGASLPAEAYDSWAPAFESYRSKFIQVDVEYSATGSGVVLDTIQVRFEFNIIGTKFNPLTAGVAYIRVFIFN